MAKNCYNLGVGHRQSRPSGATAVHSHGWLVQLYRKKAQCPSSCSVANAHQMTWGCLSPNLHEHESASHSISFAPKENSGHNDCHVHSVWQFHKCPNDLKGPKNFSGQRIPVQAPCKIHVQHECRNIRRLTTTTVNCRALVACLSHVAANSAGGLLSRSCCINKSCESPSSRESDDSR